MDLALTIPSRASQGASALVQNLAGHGLCLLSGGHSVHGSLSAQLARGTGCVCDVLSPCLVSEASSSPVPLCFCEPGLMSAMTVCSELVIPMVSLPIWARISEWKPPPKALCPKCLHRSHVDSAVVDSTPLGLGVGWGWDAVEKQGSCPLTGDLTGPQDS